MGDVSASLELSKEIPAVENKLLTIKIASSGRVPGKETLTNNVCTTSGSHSPNLISNSLASSAYNSPSLVSPPSSAFVSALQSPYISPRATAVSPLPSNNPIPTTLTHPSPPGSYCGSRSDDIPSTSYTPPPERDDFSDDPTNTKFKILTCVPVSGPETGPRVSFSFPIPRISFARVSTSPSANGKLRSCDIYIGYHGQNPNLVRFCKWLKSELELQGIACFVADRSKSSDTQSHEIADRVICSVSFGIVVISSSSLQNQFCLEEIKFFVQKKNLIPLFFEVDHNEVTSFLNQSSTSKECKEAIEAVIKSHEFKLEANEGSWRHCVSKAVGTLRTRLGRKSVAEREIGLQEELPFPRNGFFVGRQKEIMEIETTFFGCGDYYEQEHNVPDTKGGTPGHSEGFADEESEADTNRRGGFINLEVGNFKEPNLEAWVEPVLGRSSLKRPKYKKSKSGKHKSYNSSILCISGGPGVGKTELALEFAYRYSQRYKMVLWIGGETSYFRQNILNLSFILGLDVSADMEKERGRIRSFDEQESEAFRRVKRELFRDMPYLLIIDNLESEKEWWEGKDLHDLIPKNTRGCHVIITTRLTKVMNFDMIQLQPLPLSDAMILIRGRKRKDYSDHEVEFLNKLDERLGRSSFGLWLIGCLLSELAVFPSVLFEAVNQITLEEVLSSSYLNIADERFYKSNPFLIKVLAFCASVLQQTKGGSDLLSSRMLLVGAWFSPAPISTNLLATAAKNIPSARNSFDKWNKYWRLTFRCCSGCFFPIQTSDDESATLLVKLGLARIANNKQPGCWIQFHPITQMFAKGKDSLLAAKAVVQATTKISNPTVNSDHLWASAFLVFGFKSEAPLVKLKAIDLVIYIQRAAFPLAMTAFTTFSRCNSGLELLKVCTNVLDEVEKLFVSQIHDWRRGTLCWKKTSGSNQRVDEYVWQKVTLLKATLLETRAKLLLRGGQFDTGEELCRTCISVRRVMLGHNHAQTLAAQETLAKLVRMRSKI